MKVLIVTDNSYIFDKFRKIINEKSSEKIEFHFRHSPGSEDMFSNYTDVTVVDVKSEYSAIINEYDLVISCHCKRIFPNNLVNNVRCINIHPGLNPYNRGWYPQVFAINNKKPHGATIHLMDEKIDHGDIIYQREVKILSDDTSLSVYKRVVDTEIDLFSENFISIILGKYNAIKTNGSGNYNGIEDFRGLCELDLNKLGTLGEHIDLLRSLTHGQYKNAYFIDEDGREINISINLEVKD